MFYIIKQYIRFLMNSTSKYGIHSPFVFDLVTACFNKKTAKSSLLLWHNYVKDLKKNNTRIQVKDYGAGSRVFKDNTRVVSAILKNVTISKKHAALLIRLVGYFKSEKIMELGTSLGVGTLALALGNDQAVITTLEGCAETLKVAKDNLKKHVSNTIRFKEGEFSTNLQDVLEKKEYDLIYFDGNHQKEPTIAYFKQCLRAVHNETVFIFDDIYWSKEMTEAWNYIKNHPKVTLTVDIFDLGFVFFRKEQFEKEHFKIRH